MRSLFISPLALACFFAVVSTTLADTDARPISESEATASVEAPEFRILWDKTIRQGGREVIMQEVEAPVFRKPIELQAVQAHTPKFTAEEITEILSQRGKEKPNHFVTVSATIYSSQATHLKIQSHDGEGSEPVEAWSNANWNHLGGFASFEGRGQNFTFLMLSSSLSPEALRRALKENSEFVLSRIPSELPDFKNAGARYLMVKEHGNCETSLEFLEAIHDLYEAERPALIQAYKEREHQRQLQAKEPPKTPEEPKDIKISFWNNDVNN